MTAKGALVVFEGADGVGKSTLSQWFVAWLRSRGIDSVGLSFPGSDAGSLGKLVYDLHHAPSDFGVTNILPASLQLLHVAAHLDAIENRIKPRIREGCTVVLDRFWWSTWVYGLTGGAAAETIEAMIDVERTVWRPVTPSPLFLISRREPLRDEPPALWSAWCAAYLDLARRESVKYNVNVIPNEGSIEHAQNRIREIYTS